MYMCVCAHTHTLVQTQSLVFCTNLSSEMEVCDYSLQCSCCHIVKKSKVVSWTYEFYRGIQVQFAIPMNFLVINMCESVFLHCRKLFRWLSLRDQSFVLIFISFCVGINNILLYKVYKILKSLP